MFPRLRTIALAITAAFVVTLLALVFQTPSSSGPGYYRAAAQELSICGGCYCYRGAEREQCFANERAEFERANPPRGQIDGVCYATYYKWEREPGTGRQVMRSQSPIYTRIRYNETKVVGFNEVHAAWEAFIKENHEVEFPARDGWNWSRQCAALNKPKHQSEVDSWVKAQAQASYKRVFMPTFGVADTPEERALEAKAEAARQAREAERQREVEQQRRAAEARAAEEARKRAEAEAARKAELARIEAERQRKVDTIADQLGPGKRAAAERLQKMNDDLAALRPKPKPKARQCTSRTFSQVLSNTASTQAGASQSLSAAVARRGGANITGSETVLSMSAGAPTCNQRNQLALKPPPVGNCLSCISEKMAIGLFGYVPGKGYPPPKTEWTCQVTAQVTAEKCGTGPSKVSSQ